MPTILSIQSSVAYGHVGNSAATFPLQRLGIEVYPVLTVHFSNHSGYGEWRGPLLSPEDVAGVIQGIDERGALSKVDAVLSGYLGDGRVGQVVLDAVAQVKNYNDKAIYVCDTVFGDVGRGVYARPGIPEFFRDHAVSVADIVTPNHFELNFLTGTESTDLGSLLGAANALRARGPKVVLVTSAILSADQDHITLVAVSAKGAWKISTPKLPRDFTGSGDITAALFLGSYLNSGGDVPRALETTTNVVYSLLKRTHELGWRELALVPAQEEIINPTYQFEAERL
ncbi:MAG: pyridoxal kinase PdxY [Propionibacteriaceae bacterium]|jgi:pyridoxine kinase|nr:pyridoxal kinase PdxY [Propionibacteriaceae bacterium]